MWGAAAVVALACTVLLVRAVLDWRADALRWRAAAPASVLDTLALRKAIAARDAARAGERAAGARLDSALAAWARRPARSGERRGAGRTGESPVPVAPPADTAAAGECDELAEACAHYRAQAIARAIADSAAAETRRQADSAVAHGAIARAQRAAADSVAAARRETAGVERRLRRARAETVAALVAIAALLVHR